MNWHELDYSVEENRKALRRAIAEAQGWRIEPGEVINKRQFWHVFTPGGLNQVGAIDNGRFTLEWSDPCKALSAVESDLNAADALLDDTPGVGVWMTGVELALKGETNTYNVTGHTITGKLICRWHADKCIVRCLAYLAYVEWRKTQEPTK